MILTDSGLWLSASYEDVRKLYDCDARRLYPPSIVQGPEGNLNIGMRYYVPRLQQFGSTWIETWFVKSDCVKAKIDNYDCRRTINNIVGPTGRRRRHGGTSCQSRHRTFPQPIATSRSRFRYRNRNRYRYRLLLSKQLPIPITNCSTIILFWAPLTRNGKRTTGNGCN
jgi:hypothetical protein